VTDRLNFFFKVSTPILSETREQCTDKATPVGPAPYTHFLRSAGFQTCCAADFQVGGTALRAAGLETCGTAGLETCGTAGLETCGTAGLETCATKLWRVSVFL
jgi:hypothetical protein